jgi:hypothetical protein
MRIPANTIIRGGASLATDHPGLGDMLFETVDAAFREDRTVLEAQHRNIKERPEGNRENIVHDAGPAMLLRRLDQLLEEEAAEAAAAASPLRLASTASWGRRMPNPIEARMVRVAGFVRT